MNPNYEAAFSFQPSYLLIKKFCLENKVNEPTAVEWFEETKKFLILSVINHGKTYSPSKEVDKMWHQFLLHSKEYAEFCSTLNCFIHHQPSEKPNRKNYQNTRRDMKRMYGKLNSYYWSQNQASESDCDCCPIA